MIAIASMEALPDHCPECPCHNGEGSYCKADKEQRYHGWYRPYWCPLKEVHDDQDRRISGMIDKEKLPKTGKWILDDGALLFVDEYGHFAYAGKEGFKVKWK